MNVVDSSGWLEYFADGVNATFFAEAIEKTPELIVPTISIYEVYKKTFQSRGQDAALKVVASMMQGHVIELDSTLAIEAARRSVEFGLPMADSIILATASAYEAIFWTQDADFVNMEGVHYVEKK
jgi:predicted nucleic acid-binding protein